MNKGRFEFVPDLTHDQAAADHIEAELSMTLTEEDWKDALFRGVRERAEAAEYAMLVQIRTVFESLKTDGTFFERIIAQTAVNVVDEIILAHMGKGKQK
jgi:hypothetical protein